MDALRIVQRQVFTGIGRWKLACGPLLLEAVNGDLLCAWLSGGDGEPARDNCVLLSHSTDRGHTWEEAQIFLPAGEQASALTSWFTTADGSIVAFAASLVRLPSRCIALIHNATGQKGVFGTRNPLSIWISDDGLRTWTMRKDVIATVGSYRPASWGAGPDQLAYPEATVIDGRLVFVYDRNRRDVLFVATDLK